MTLFGQLLEDKSVKSSMKWEEALKLIQATVFTYFTEEPMKCSKVWNGLEQGCVPSVHLSLPRNPSCFRKIVGPRGPSTMVCTGLHWQTF